MCGPPGHQTQHQATWYRRRMNLTFQSQSVRVHHDWTEKRSTRSASHLDSLGVCLCHLGCPRLLHPLQQFKQVCLSRQLERPPIQRSSEGCQGREIQSGVAVEDADWGFKGVQATHSVKRDLQLATIGEASDGSAKQQRRRASDTTLQGFEEDI